MSFAFVIAILSLSDVQAMSPDKAFETLQHRITFESCLTQPNRECVFEIAFTVAKNSVVEKNLTDLAKVQARGAFFDSALSLTQQIVDKSLRTETLASIAVEQARAGRMEDALAIAEEIELTGNSIFYIQSLSAIATAQVCRGNEVAKNTLNKAIKIIESRKTRATGRAWLHIIEAQLEVDDLDGALRSLQVMRDANAYHRWTIQALNAIALSQAAAGYDEKALETFSEARNLAQSKDNDDVGYLLSQIAVAQKNAGYIGLVATTLSDAVKTAMNADEILSFKKMKEVLQALRNAGQVKTANDIVKLAVNKAKNELDELNPMESWTSEHYNWQIAKSSLVLSLVQILVGEIDEAKNTLDQINHSSVKSRGLAELAIAQWKSGLIEDANTTLGEAKEIADDAAYKHNYQVMMILSQVDISNQRLVSMTSPLFIQSYERIAVALATVGDVSGALRFAENAGGANFDSLYEILYIAPNVNTDSDSRENQCAQSRISQLDR